MPTTPHKTLPSAECHEEKHIQLALPSDAGKVLTPSAVAGVGELRNLKQQEIILETNRQTGLATSTIVVETVKRSILNLGPNASQIVTVQLGVAASATVRRVVVRNQGGGGKIKIVTADAANIHGWSELWLVSPYDAVELVTDGTEWFVINTNMTASSHQFVRDNQYTSGAPQAVVAATRTKLTNNALGAGQEAYKDTRYDLWDQTNSRLYFTKPGDVLSIRFAVRAKMAAANGAVDLESSFPAPTTGTNIITWALAKGGGIENRIITEYSFFIDDFAMTQGYMEFWVTPTVNMDFYSFSLLATVNSRRPFGGNG
jgi:hypothetical protein